MSMSELIRKNENLLGIKVESMCSENTTTWFIDGGEGISRYAITTAKETMIFIVCNINSNKKLKEFDDFKKALSYVYGRVAKEII